MDNLDFFNHEYINIDGNRIHKTAIICDNVKLGQGNVVQPYAVIGEVGSIRDANESSGMVRIGDDNVIGHHVTIMSGSSGLTSIGDKNLIQNKVNIGHNALIRNNCEIGAGSIIAGHAIICDNVRIKIMCAIRNRIKIEENVIVGMGSVVVKDVPEGVVVFGNPATDFKGK